MARFYCPLNLYGPLTAMDPNICCDSFIHDKSLDLGPGLSGWSVSFSFLLNPSPPRLALLATTFDDDTAQILG
jgi:hypothetical protein